MTVEILFDAVVAVAVRAVCTLLSSRMSYLSSKAVKRTLRGKIYKKLLGLGALLPRAGEHLGGGAGGCGGRGPAGDVFRLLPAPVLLRHAGAPDAVWRAQLCELPAALVLFLCVPLIPAAIVAVQRWAKKLLSKYWGSTPPWATPSWRTCKG